MQTETLSTSLPAPVFTHLGARVISAPYVLIADDDGSVRCGVAKTLRHAGYLVGTCADGAELLDAIAEIARWRVDGREARLDLVLCDVRMPKFSGLEALESLRLAGWDVPFVLMTGWPNAEADCRAHGLRAAGLLQKPLTRAALLAVVDALAPRSDDR